MKANTSLHLQSFFGNRLKRLRTLVGCVAVWVITLCTGIASAATVVYDYNGSFELGTTSPPVAFPTGSRFLAISGWLGFSTDTESAWLEDSFAQDGDRYLRLSSNGGARPTLTSIVWDLPEPNLLTDGQDYLIHLWAAGGVGTLNTLDIRVGGLQVSRINLPDYTLEQYNALGGIQWQEYVIPFTASSDLQGTIDLVSPALGSSSLLNRSTIYLDNVSIVAVPEPGSALLLLSAAGVVSFQRRRKMA
jgi:hypothetical protein